MYCKPGGLPGVNIWEFVAACLETDIMLENSPATPFSERTTKEELLTELQSTLTLPTVTS